MLAWQQLQRRGLKTPAAKPINFVFKNRRPAPVKPGMLSPDGDRSNFKVYNSNSIETLGKTHRKGKRPPMTQTSSKPVPRPVPIDKLIDKPAAISTASLISTSILSSTTSSSNKAHSRSGFAVAEIDATFLPPTLTWKVQGTKSSAESFVHPLQNLILFEDKHIITVYKPNTVLSQASLDKNEFNMFDCVVDYLTAKRLHRLGESHKRVQVPSALSGQAQADSKHVTYLLSYPLSSSAQADMSYMDHEDTKEEWRHYLSVVNRLDRPCSGTKKLVY
jgi:23S rRNA-/tRNA-specific pseudouridylate synthase